MLYLTLKYLITAAVVVLVSEIARRNDKLGGLFAALPLITILSLIWLHLDHQSTDKITKHARYTFWYVLPTLPMFLAFPWLLERLGFWLTLFISTLISIVCFLVLACVLKQIKIALW